MDQSNTPDTPAATRHDGWTPERRARFLERLAGHGDVRAACAVVGLSREAAYRLRRRDALFAGAWAAALVLAREASAEVLACRAIDGIEEEVWYRGEVVGTRRRYDTRLLLAHMARLDAQASDGSAQADAACFDELVAMAAGAQPPEDMVTDGDSMIPGREAYIAAREEQATREAWDEIEEKKTPDDGIDDLLQDKLWEARTDAAALWDAWASDARATVDRLLHDADADDAEFSPGTVSTVSTSPDMPTVKA